MRDDIASRAIGQIATEGLLSAMGTLDLDTRVLVFAHVAVGFGLESLSKELDRPTQEIRQVIQDGLTTLRTHPDIRDLANIRTLGDHERFFLYVQNLGLGNWFCSECRQFQVQRGRGRPRITCSEHCRYKRWRRLHSN